MNISPQLSVPKLSVVIPSFNSLAVLEKCLVALAPQNTAEIVEILVIRDQSRESAEYQMLQEKFDKIQWLAAPPAATVPKMRLLGITHSQGEIVALIEDDCIVGSNWCTAVIQAHQSPEGAIGGAVEPGAYTKGLDWGVYFCEYARFMQPFAGLVKVLPGNNVSYKRIVLDQLLQDHPNDEGFYEVFMHSALQQAGETLKADPTLVVHNCNSWEFTNISTVPFHHGRGFAGMRFIHQPWKRIPFLGLALLLPIVQMSRIVIVVIKRRRYIFELFKAIPDIFLFSSSWSFGEFMGYLFGSGNSLKQWR
jgi:glycosyltransferase involved in cell wall biosynthesis